MKDACIALLSPAVGRTERLSAWNEVFALVLLFAGTLLFFALISYTPRDIPSWLWFSHVSPANHPAQNFIGPLGAIVAGICYQLIGVFASLLLAAVLLGFGAAKLFYPRLRVLLRIPWIVLFLISGACLDQAWGISPLLGRKVPVDIQGPGGLIGYRLSDENRGLLPAAHHQSHAVIAARHAPSRPSTRNGATGASATSPRASISRSASGSKPCRTAPR